MGDDGSWSGMGGDGSWSGTGGGQGSWQEGGSSGKLPCKFFAQGFCKNGADCGYLHEGPSGCGGLLGSKGKGSADMGCMGKGCMGMGCMGKGCGGGLGKQGTGKGDGELTEIGQYQGVIKSFNPNNGYGFIDCPQLKAEGQMNDVFLHQAQLGDFAVGSPVIFTLYLTPKGQPRAKNLVSAGEQQPAWGGAEQSQESKRMRLG